MSKTDPFALDRAQMRASFARAARNYDAAARLQRNVADNLLERLDFVKVEPARVLDLGSGTGYCSNALARRYRNAQIIGIDVAEPMLQKARIRSRWKFSSRRRRYICADAERLPLANGSVDLIVSSLMLQWCQPVAVFKECLRVLSPGGLFVFSSFGPDTLRELRVAWSTVDSRPHVHGFLDLRDIGDLLLARGFADPVVDIERTTLRYGGVLEVLHDLKRIGAHNVAHDRNRGLTGKQSFARFRQAYESMANSDGIPATYEMVFGQAWAPSGEPARRHGDEGDVAIPISMIRRRHG